MDVNRGWSFECDDSAARCVLVCQHRSCRKQGGDKVLAAFGAHSVAGVRVVGSGCLGQCGMGPMVRIVPDEVWYCRVRPDEVPVVVERHLKGGQAIAAMLYRKFHP